MEPKLTKQSMTAAMSDESLPKPTLRNRTGRYRRLNMSLNGFSTASDLIVSSVRHCSSASTSAPDPRTRCKARLASSILPRCIRLLAVSGTSSVPAVMINAGTAARPSESRQPQPWILAVP
ncbi:hypothetical protein EJ110_NYTH01854 [Nymphaea thermarum]|nr:hypothetical protein EJ110_NYTH01854 [Nymphaea thermarum]